MYKQFPLESRWIKDADTGRAFRQVTNFPCVNHHPFFLAPAYAGGGRWLVFVSHRTGAPQLYAEDQETGCILQLTDVANLDEWSVAPADDRVYFCAGEEALRVSLRDGQVETLLSRAACHEQFGSVIGEGTTALTADGLCWAVRIKNADGFGILIRNEITGHWEQAYQGPMVAHLQFCPDDNDLLFFAGPLTDRVWILDRTQGQARRVYTRNVAAKQWITHESWIPGRRELSLVDWPHGILGVHVDTGEVRRITDINAWHAISCDQGDAMVVDTNFPDRGIWLLDPRRNKGQTQLLCCPHASCMGDHWSGPFPYDNGPIKVYAPQHTHPHPRFSPDGRRIVFTSDAGEFAQVYELDLEQILPDLD